MLCCIRRTKPVEKTEEADQEIKQDGTKPEDKAHKAATKIQASFRGHIIRKKMKDDDKEEDSPAAEAKAEDNEGEKKEEEKAASPTADKQDEAAKEEEKAKSPINSPAAEESKAEAPATSPSEPKKDVKEEPKEAEKPKEAESADIEAEKPSENVDAEKEEGKEEEKKAEAKQAIVPVTASETADSETEVKQTQDKPDAAEDSEQAEGDVSGAANEEDKAESA